MAFRLQMLQGLVEAHPDRANRLKIHVEALETAIAIEPGRCLERVRALFEATFHSIAPQLGLEPVVGETFQAQNRRLINALDFALDGHPETERIAAVIQRLVGSVNGTIGALAELSNIPGLRHGGSLDWTTLHRHHAMMLGGLCDSLVTFMFDIAWSRVPESVEAQLDRYVDYPEWNESLDEEWGSIRIADGEYWASRVLFALDPTQYEALRTDWSPAAGEEEVEAE